MDICRPKDHKGWSRPPFWGLSQTSLTYLSSIFWRPCHSYNSMVFYRDAIAGFSTCRLHRRRGRLSAMTGWFHSVTPHWESGTVDRGCCSISSSSTPPPPSSSSDTVTCPREPEAIQDRRRQRTWPEKDNSAPASEALGVNREQLLASR
jgi:hypothetical protein